MKIEKLQNLNLGNRVSPKEIEDILAGETEKNGYGIPDIQCTGGSGSCLAGCRSGCKSSVKENDCSSSCQPGCSEYCKETCKNNK